MPLGMGRFAILCTLTLFSCASTNSSRDPGSVAAFTAAEKYEQFMGRWSAKLAVPFAAFARLQQAPRVLDVGSGTGALSFVVRDTSPSTQIEGIDVSQNYVAFASAHNTDARVHFSVGDAQHLIFPDASFDAAAALLVMNFVPDADQGVSEMIRVTRPGGTVSAAVWDYGGEMAMLRVFDEEAAALDGVAVAAFDERTMKLSHRGALAELWRKHGLINVEEQPLVIEQPFESFEAFWQPFLLGQGVAGAYVAKLSEAQRVQLKARLQQRLSAGNGPFTLRAQAWAVRGEVK